MHYLESQKSSLLTTIHKVGAIFNQVWLSDGNKISCEQSSNLFLILQILPISNVYKGGNSKRTFCYPQFFQKMNKIIRLYYYHSSGRLVSFVFWKNWRHKKRHFELSDFQTSCKYLPYYMFLAVDIWKRNAISASVSTTNIFGAIIMRSKQVNRSKVGNFGQKKNQIV